MPVFEVVHVNNVEEAKRFFDAYNIQYEIISRGENKGMLRTRRTREKDSYVLLEVRRQLEDAGLGAVCDHSNVFRDANDRTVVTFSPYHLLPLATLEQYLYGYDVEISDYSIYGYGTRTIVIRRQGY
jgi:hypothetical protein